MIKLNLGCKNHYKKNWVNLDNDMDVKADIYYDLNGNCFFPFKENSFDFILASHIIEHLDNPINFFKEAERILKSNGMIEIIVPHFTNNMSFDPLHKGYYNYKSIEHIKGQLRIIKKRIIFTRMYKWLEAFANRFPDIYESSPLRSFPAKEINVKLEKWTA